MESVQSIWAAAWAPFGPLPMQRYTPEHTRRAPHSTVSIGIGYVCCGERAVTYLEDATLTGETRSLCTAALI